VRLRKLTVRFIERRALVILILVVALSALAGWGLTGIEVVTSQEAFISADSDAYQGFLEYGEEFGGDSLVVLIPGSPLDFAVPEALEGFADLESELMADPGVLSVISPMTLFGPAAQQAGLDLSSPSAALELAMQDESLQAQLARFFPNNHALVIVRLVGGLSTDEQGEAADYVVDTVAANPLSADAIVAGNPRMMNDVRSAIFSGLAQSGIIAVVLMVVILFIAFPARWRLLSLPLVLVGVLWTFGIAAVASVPLTLVTLAGLPILIGLGVDFAIQFHNRYEEEMRRGELAVGALDSAISHIGPTVGVAVAVMILGFLTLLMSAVPGVRDFGVLLAIGAAVLFAVSLFVLNAFLYRFDRRPRMTPGSTADTGLRQRLLEKDWLYLSRALPAVARWSRKHAVWVVSLAVIFAVLGLVADRHLTVQTDIEKLIPSDTPGVVAIEKAREVVGSAIDLPLLIRTPDATAPEFVEWLAEFEDQTMASHPEIVGTDSLASLLGVQAGDPAPSAEEIGAALDGLPPAIRSGLINADATAASLTFSLGELEMATLNDLIDDLIESTDIPAGVTITPGGLTVLSARTVEAFTVRRGFIELVGILAVLLGLILIYRDWRRALIAVIPVALVTGWSSAFMWVTGVDLNPLTAVLGALVIAVGTEFTVLLLSRYYEERARGIARDEAIDEAVTKVGRAITASGLTVAAGFGALVFSKFPALRDFGIVIVVDVIFALVVTVTVVPALVHWIHRGRAASPPG